MPFTPYHLGPGILFKGIFGSRFSFMVFGGTQVLMDIEPLIGIFRGWHILHGRTHTILGALLIGTVAGVIGKPISNLVLNWLRVTHYPLTWSSSFIAAYIGTFSHIFLDALMHSDISPWWPISSGNKLLGLVSPNTIHMSCVISGVLGAIVCAVVLKRRGAA
jgi:uncharacterized membrane protein YeaQ/YmgE (transglycosylase-associated protein family)